VNDKKENPLVNPAVDALAVVCWILPLAGLVWGPGAWWVYLLWLVVGTGVIMVVMRDDDDEEEKQA